MSLQNLDPNFPDNVDLLSVGSGALRDIKSNIKAAFTSLSTAGGVVTASAAEMNYLAGVTGNVQSQIDTKGSVPWTFPPRDSVDGRYDVFDLIPNTKIIPKLEAPSDSFEFTIPDRAGASDGDLIEIKPGETTIGSSNFVAYRHASESFLVFRNQTNLWQTTSLVVQRESYPHTLVIYSSSLNTWIIRALDSVL